MPLKMDDLADNFRGVVEQDPLARIDIISLGLLTIIQ